MFEEEDDQFWDFPDDIFQVFEADPMSQQQQQVSGGAHANAAAATAPQPQLTIKTSVDLPVYSGHPVNQKYTGKDGVSTELYRVQDWLFEIQKIGRAGNWSETTMATQAAMKLIPGSPAANWIKVVEQSNNAAAIAEISTWSTFKAAMVREFGAPADFGSLVALLQSFKQEQNELVRDFHNRLVLGYNEFALSMPDSFVGQPWDSETSDQKSRRLEAATVACNFHLRAFFVAGLKPEIRKEVIKNGPTTVEEILKLAKRIEQAKLQEKKTQSSGNISSAALNAAVNARLAELGFTSQAAGAAAAAASGAKPKESGGRRKERQGDIVCFYCGASHLASKCERRAADRNRGVWRATIRCPESSKAQWDAMSKEDRNKGQRTFGKAAAVGQPSAEQPEAGSSQAAASVIPGLTYSHAAQGPLESAFNAYRRQGN